MCSFITENMVICNVVTFEWKTKTKNTISFGEVCCVYFEENKMWKIFMTDFTHHPSHDYCGNRFIFHNFLWKWEKFCCGFYSFLYWETLTFNWVNIASLYIQMICGLFCILYAHTQCSDNLKSINDLFSVLLCQISILNLKTQCFFPGMPCWNCIVIWSGASKAPFCA